MQVRFHRLADAEYQRFARLLARESAAKRNRWIQAVGDAVGRIAANPAIGSPVFVNYRWVRVGRFKFLLYYRQLTDSLILIYAVAHTSRRPGYWLGRTRRP